jgi:hypothetical protein
MTREQYEQAVADGTTPNGAVVFQTRHGWDSDGGSRGNDVGVLQNGRPFNSSRMAGPLAYGQNTRDIVVMLPREEAVGSGGRTLSSRTVRRWVARCSGVVFGSSRMAVSWMREHSKTDHVPVHRSSRSFARRWSGVCARSTCSASTAFSRRPSASCASARFSSVEGCWPDSRSDSA